MNSPKAVVAVTCLSVQFLFIAGCTTVDSNSKKETAGLAAFDPLDFRAVIHHAKDKVYPTVVYIRCLHRSMESGEAVTNKMAGSGVLISPDGHLLTNWHVVNKAVRIRCLLLDGTNYNARLIGSDKDLDLALLRLETLEGKEPPRFVYATMGDSSKLEEGSFVMAMGAPLGLSRSISMGIISCARRYLPGNSQYSLWLQTDAAINPGNSGGPLVNTEGKIVGINTLGLSMSGIGFAIPSKTILDVIERLKNNKGVQWTWLGLQLQPLKDFDKNVYFEATEGVIVAGTDPESPARRAGILDRDRIVAVNDIPVTATHTEDLPGIRRMVGLLPKNKSVKIALVRDKQTRIFNVTPRDKGKVEGEEFDCPRWDMTVKSINQFDNPDLYYFRKKGVFIYGIKYPGNAGEANLREKDIILKIGNEEVKSLEDIKRIHKRLLANIKNKHQVLFVVSRNGNMRQAILDFSRDHERD